MFFLHRWLCCVLCGAGFDSYYDLPALISSKVPGGWVFVKQTERKRFFLRNSVIMVSPFHKCGTESTEVKWVILRGSFGCATNLLKSLGAHWFGWGFAERQHNGRSTIGALGAWWGFGKTAAVIFSLTGAILVSDLNEVIHSMGTFWQFRQALALAACSSTHESQAMLLPRCWQLLPWSNAGSCVGSCRFFLRCQMVASKGCGTRPRNHGWRLTAVCLFVWAMLTCKIGWIPKTKCFNDLRYWTAYN